MANYEKIGMFKIFFNEMYYIAYAGGKRELLAKDQKEYDKTLGLPLLLQIKEKRKIPYEKNPNVVPIKGINLLSFIRELKYVPFFDKFFEQSHLLKIRDPIVYESMRQKNYDIALRN